MQDKKAKTKEQLIGKQVVDSEGNDAGTIKDVAFTVGQTGITLIAEDKEGEQQEISWDDVQAAKDFIILKPKTEVSQSPSVAQPVTQPTSAQPAQLAQAQANVCPTCGKPLTYIKEYKRWYCYNEKKYV